jgi:DNA-binding MarR family transcriptional regulator
VVDEDYLRAVRVMARLARLLERTQTPLSLSQYRLIALAQAKTDRSSNLAQGLSLTKPTVSVTIDGLVAQGLVRRVRDPQDRRALRVELTDAGRDALRATEEALAARLRPLFSEVSDPARLLSLLQEVEGLLDEARERRTAAESSAEPQGAKAR